jgi:hypothetical protein
MGAEHTHAANVPADVHVCAPRWPLEHAHTTLRPGTHF